MTSFDLPAAARADLDAGLAALGLDQALAEPLTRYLSLLQRWNAAYNMTAIRDPREMVTKHLLDSLAKGTSGDTHSLVVSGHPLFDLPPASTPHRR
jgi:16S rRNA G527 N7-methylase RsmG